MSSEASIPAASIQVDFPSSVISVGPAMKSHSTQRERAGIATNILIIFYLLFVIQTSLGTFTL